MKIKPKGFTLIETMIAIAVFTILTVAIFSFVTMLYRYQDMVFMHSETVEEARRGLSRMVNEIREAGPGEDGSYLIQKANDHEIIFYSDISGDGRTEKVRYYISPAGGKTGSETKTCTSFQKGGSCEVSFFGFLENDLKSATLSVSVEGDLDHPNNEYADIFVDSFLVETLCRGGGTCAQCAGSYQDLRLLDVTSAAADGFLTVSASVSENVDPICHWEDPNHSLKAMFTLSWEEEPLSHQNDLFIKEVVSVGGWPPFYDDQNAEITVISNNVRNEAREEPVFVYYNRNNQPITNLEERIKETTLIETTIILNSDPGRPPDDFTIVSAVKLRNIKDQ